MKKRDWTLRDEIVCLDRFIRWVERKYIGIEDRFELFKTFLIWRIKELPKKRKTVSIIKPPIIEYEADKVAEVDEIEKYIIK